MEALSRCFTQLRGVAQRIVGGHAAKCEISSYPLRLLDPNAETKIGIIVLNNSTKCDCIACHLNKVWKKGLIKVAADGAADKLRNIGDGCFIPDVLCGDFDSISDSTMQFLQNKGTEMVHLPDQNSTDFTKCIQTISNKIAVNQQPIEDVVAIGGLCGRFDHVLGCLNSLCINQKENPHIGLYLLHNESLVTLLQQGEHHVHLDLERCTGKCGLVPLGIPVENVYTDGFRWNLNGHTLAYGSLISTSNEILQPVVHVSNPQPLLFSLELKL